MALNVRAFVCDAECDVECGFVLSLGTHCPLHLDTMQIPSHFSFALRCVTVHFFMQPWHYPFPSNLNMKQSENVN
jgi:hypothetical protein